MAKFNELGNSSMSNHISDAEEYEAENRRLYPEQYINQNNINTQESVSEIIEELNEDEQFLAEMSDVELRLEEANCYKALLNNTLFEDAGPVARLVENKVRDFIKNELRVLLGITVKQEQVKVQSSFTSEEEEALKEIAFRLIEKKKAVANIPSVTPVQAVKPVTEDPKVRTSKVSPVLSVKKSVKQNKTPTDSPKPVGRPPKKDKSVKMQMNLPDGSVKEVSINAREQVKPPMDVPGRIPPMSAQQIADAGAMQAQTQSLNAGTKNDMLGLAIRVATQMATE